MAGAGAGLSQEEYAALTLEALRDKGWWNMITQAGNYIQVLQGYYGLTEEEARKIHKKFVSGGYADLIARTQTEQTKREIEKAVANATGDRSGTKGSIVLQTMAARGFLDPGQDETQSKVPTFAMPPDTKPTAYPELPPKMPLAGDALRTYFKWLTALRDLGSINMGYAPQVHGNDDQAAKALARTYGLSRDAAMAITQAWRQSYGGGRRRRKTRTRRAPPRRRLSSRRK
jgi:hypothetical protein